MSGHHPDVQGAGMGGLRAEALGPRESEGIAGPVRRGPE
jgi:hypothetical protein